MPQKGTPYTPNPDRPWEHDESQDPVKLAKQFQQQKDVTDLQGRTIADTSGPKIGDRKTVNGVTGEFDGETWRQVGERVPSADEQGSAWLGHGPGYHPGADTSPGEAELRGFLSGAINSPVVKPVGLGLAGTGAVMAGAPAIPAVLAAGGATAGLDLLRSFLNEPTAPQSGGEYLGDLAESAAGPASAGALGAAGSALANTGMGATKASALLGGGVGAAEGYHRGGLTGALEGAATGAAGGGILGRYGSKFGKLAQMLGMGGAEAAPEAAAAAEAEGGFAPGASGGRTPEKWPTMSDPIPDTSHWSKPAYEPYPVSPEAGQPSPVDKYMPNVGADSHEPAASQVNFPVGQPAAAQPYGSGGPMRVQQPQSDQSFVDSLVDRSYTPNTSGYQPHTEAAPEVPPMVEPKPTPTPTSASGPARTTGTGWNLAEPPAPVRTTPASIEALTPQQVGQAGMGNFRSGAGLPGSARPSELMTEPPFPDTHVWDQNLGMSLPKDQQFDVVGAQNEFYGDRPDVSTSGQSDPNYTDVQALINSMGGPAAKGAAAAAPGSSPSMDALTNMDEGDAYWGPGTVSRRTGAPAQASEVLGNKDGNSTLLYDPQTPTSYLRYQLQTATDPAEREFLRSTISQRVGMHARPGKMAGVQGKGKAR